jgi:transposase
MLAIVQMAHLRKENTAMAKNVADPRRKSKKVELLDGERVFVGLDVHKGTYSVALYVDGRGQVAEWTQPASPDTLIRKLHPIKSQVARVVYEAGPTGFTLYRALIEVGFDAGVIAASHTPNPSVPEDKTDRIDCRKLAFLAAKDMLHPIDVPTPQEEDDRQWLRRRDQVNNDVRRAKHRIRSLLLQYGIAEPEGLKHWSKAACRALEGLEVRPGIRLALDSLLEELRQREAERDRLTRCIKALAEQDRHKVTASLLQTVPGVAHLTAMTLILEMPRPERFHSREQVSAYQGLAPSIRQSGKTEHRGRLRKSGDKRLRTALVRSAWQWVAHDPWAKEHFKQLCGKLRVPQKALVAMARRLGILLWRMATRGEIYVPRSVGATG